MLRWADPAQDAAPLAMLFFKAVRTGDSPYTEAERHAWLPKVPDPEQFAHRLGQKEVAVCEADGAPVGFMSLEPGGYIDLAFILPEHQGTGVFRRLLDRIERQARQQGEPRLWTHASLMAQPAFRAMGFLVIQHETVERAGESLRRAEMEKVLK